MARIEITVEIPELEGDLKLDARARALTGPALESDEPPTSATAEITIVSGAPKLLQLFCPGTTLESDKTWDEMRRV